MIQFANKSVVLEKFVIDPLYKLIDTKVGQNQLPISDNFCCNLQ